MERRSSIRYPLDLEVQYRVLGESEHRTAHAVNFSSGGILIRCPYPIRSGTQVELRIPWPASRDGGALIQLQATGQVLQHHGERLRVQFDSYEFLHVVKPISAKLKTLSANVS
jgi:c-di-GMP-binding flagellar brake protein YcgR